MGIYGVMLFSAGMAVAQGVILSPAAIEAEFNATVLDNRDGLFEGGSLYSRQLRNNAAMKALKALDEFRENVFVRETRRVHLKRVRDRQEAAWRNRVESHMYRRQRFDDLLEWLKEHIGERMNVWDIDKVYRAEGEFTGSDVANGFSGETISAWEIRVQDELVSESEELGGMLNIIKAVDAMVAIDKLRNTNELAEAKVVWDRIRVAGAH